jgi:histidinol-phosphate/aromatic aminotransferase/cobyric acid decarboxylase-like protein
LHEALAHLAGVETGQVMPGAGSTEVLHCALDAFTFPSKPLITAWPTWEIACDVVEAAGRRVVKVRLTKQWSADVARLAHESRQVGGGVIHLGNPNNPTSSATPKNELRWLAEHLPPSTVLLVDEAYIQFANPAEVESVVAYVREGRSVIATRTFSKLYGIAGVRVGFGCGPSDLLKHMATTSSASLGRARQWPRRNSAKNGGLRATTAARSCVAGSSAKGSATSHRKRILCRSMSGAAFRKSSRECWPKV